jgi:hypothetical protein
VCVGGITGRFAHHSTVTLSVTWANTHRNPGSYCDANGGPHRRAHTGATADRRPSSHRDTRAESNRNSLTDAKSYRHALADATPDTGTGLRPTY